MCAKLLQLCMTLCDPMDHSLPGSSVHGILQARILEWEKKKKKKEYWSGLPCPPPGPLPTLQRSNPHLLRPPALVGGFFTTSTTLFSCSIVSQSMGPFQLQPARLLFLWNFPGRNTGVGCHFLFQCHLGSPLNIHVHVHFIHSSCNVL